MVETETSQEVIPVNSHCSAIPNKTVINPPTGTTSANNIALADSTSTQLNASAQYDNVDSITVKPMYGGNENYKIKYRKKDYTILANSEENAIKIILNGRVYKKDSLLEINNSLYVIRANYKNKFKKIH